jgi:peptidoglycan/LPS O-acetylase OafA/YrhL
MQSELSPSAANPDLSMASTRGDGSASTEKIEADGQVGRGHHAGRVAQIDTLKVLLVAWVIACHALVGYTTMGGWPYDEVNEVVMSPRAEFALSITVGPTALFVIGTFFFLAGLFAHTEVGRHGIGGFAVTRVIRLGLPWLVFMLGIWPLFMWFAYRAAGYDISLWEAFLGRQPFLDAGPLWFAQILMYVSLGYALWRWGWRRYGQLAPPARITELHLLAVVAAITLASFIVRLWFPARSQQILDLHLWQWPQCMGMFCLGVMVSGLGWTARVPSRIARNCGLAVLGMFVVLPLIVFATGVTDIARDDVPFLGGWHWQALVLAAVEGVLVVAGSVWLLAWAQSSFPTGSRVLKRCGQVSYLAYMLQVPVLISLHIAMRPAPLPATLKGLLVGLTAVVVSFAMGWLLRSRTALGRVL